MRKPTRHREWYIAPGGASSVTTSGGASSVTTGGGTTSGPWSCGADMVWYSFWFEVACVSLMPVSSGKLNCDTTYDCPGGIESMSIVS